MIFFFSHSHKIRTLQGLCPLPPHSHICGWWTFPAFLMLLLRYCSRCCCMPYAHECVIIASIMSCCILFLNFVFIRFIWENTLSTAELLSGNASMDKTKSLSLLKSFSPDGIFVICNTYPKLFHIISHWPLNTTKSIPLLIKYCQITLEQWQVWRLL